MLLHMAEGVIGVSVCLSVRLGLCLWSKPRFLVAVAMDLPQSQSYYHRLHLNIVIHCWWKDKLTVSGVSEQFRAGAHEVIPRSAAVSIGVICTSCSETYAMPTSRPIVENRSQLMNVGSMLIVLIDTQRTCCHTAPTTYQMVISS